MDEKSKTKSSIVTRTKTPGLDIVSVARPNLVEYYITATPVRGKSQFSMFESVANFIKDTGATIVSQDVFGPCKFYRDGMFAMKAIHGSVNWPVSWIEGDGYVADTMTGTQVYAISGSTVQPIIIDGKYLGGVYEDEDAKYCLLGNITAKNLSASRLQQNYETFEKMENTLMSVGMDFSNVVRTWLYTAKIHESYGDLNKARDTFFKERGVFQGLVPASTAIGVANPANASMVADVFAVKPKTDKVHIEKIASPLQCPALDYKSSFSRAVELRVPGHTTLFISGTASIEQGGKTAHLGDLEKQIDLSMRVAHAILESRGMDWGNVSRIAAYFQDIKEAPMLYNYYNSNRIGLPPIAVAHADICRDDLLFEFELDAIKHN